MEIIYGAHANMQYTLGYFLSGWAVTLLLFCCLYSRYLFYCHIASPPSLPPSAPSIIDQRARLPLVSRQVTTGQRSCRSKYPTLKWPSWSTGKVISLGGVHSFNVAKTIWMYTFWNRDHEIITLHSHPSRANFDFHNGHNCPQRKLRRHICMIPRKKCELSI